ncbi:MAG: 2-iminoacetate synthase ThiH [Candidatus Omnitrophota bacterium]
MSFYGTISAYKGRGQAQIFKNVPPELLRKALRADEVTDGQFASLLSQGAQGSLEEMAGRSRELTLRYFGRTVQLYTPLYLSNYCDNGCVYCGFNSANTLERKRLSVEEVEKEARLISSTGLKHILVLTGDSREKSPVSYIKSCVKALKKYFDSISIEIYALTEDEYAELAREGVDGLTIYQEVYDEDIYSSVHPAGPKRDYKFRLDAPERGAAAGFRNVSIGTLFGLGDWRREVFLMGLHARYLMDKFPGVDIGASIPRIRPNAGAFSPMVEVSDSDIVQTITALRIFLPRLSISVSTREDPGFRENILPIGVTRMSAGSTTCVGGHSIKADENGRAPQFEISDRRSVDEIRAMLEKKGYQPVFKDWMEI